MTAAPWQATLYLEVRSRGSRPGQSNIEHRVYTTVSEASESDPDCAEMQMIHRHEYGVSVHTWMPAEFDAVARTSVFRETLRGSDKLLRDLELYGWTRRRDLEVAPEAGS